jgi:hypothetical protein
MQPNLKIRNAASLEFSVTLPLSSDLVSQIRDTSSPDNDGDSVFFDSYKGHRVIAIVNGIDKDAKEYKVLFVYQARGGGKLPKRLPRIAQLVDILSSIREQLNFECQVLFTFGRNLRRKPIISLPMRYIEAPDMPFDRIQGLHLVKLDNSQTKYEVFLEAPAKGVLIETIVFKHMSMVDESLPDKILTEAESISNRLVLKELKDARKPS